MLAAMRRLLTPSWLAMHALMIILVAGMLGLAAWQLWRAAGGNMLSWGYTVQWPVFAGFVVFVWAREVRRTLRGEPAVAPAPPEPTPPPAAATSAPPVITRRTARSRVTDEADDPELAAYNRYLAWLNAHPHARAADYPG
jgi:hypothetical protein